MKEYFRDKNLWIAAGITIALTFVMFALNGIVFTNKIYAQADMKYQFIPFFEGIKAHEGGALFTWNMGGGMSLWHLMTYCFMSPFNILALIFPVPHTMNVIIALKMGVMALTFAASIKYFFKKSGWLPIAFSVGYATSGYVLANMWNLMWFDAVYLFPILMIGLYRLVRYKKFLLFSIILGATIVSNYFIATTVLITCIIVFVLLCVCYKKKNILYFLLSLGIALGISAIVIIPQIMMYKYTLVANEGIGDFKAMLPFGELIARHMMNSPSYVDEYWFPNIYMGVFFIPVLPLIFLSKLERRKKICVGILLGLFIFSFMFTYPNFIWNGFHYTNSVMSRHSFMYIFFCLFFSFMVISQLKDYKRKHILVSLVTAAVYMLVMLKFGSNETTSVSSVVVFRYNYRDLIINAVFLGMYIIFLLEKIRVLAFLILSEFCVNFFFVGFKPPSAENTNPLYDFSIMEVEERIEVPRKGRSEFIGNEFNKGMELHFPSVSSFSSASPKSFKDLSYFGINGCYNATTNQYTLNGATEILFDIFSIDNLIEDNKITQRKSWGFGFLVNDSSNQDLPNQDSLNQDFYLEGYWLNNQNKLFEAGTGIKDAIIPIENEIPDDGWLYANFGEKCKVNGIEYPLSNTQITKIKEVRKGEKLELENANFFFLSKKVREEGLRKQKSLNIEKFENGFISGVAPATGTYVFTTPIQPGWEAFVNNQKAEIKGYGDLFISVELQEGDNLELKYHTPGLAAGIIVTLSTIVFVIIIREKKNVDSNTCI